MWAQCDLDGNQHILMDSIVDSRKNGDAVPMDDKYFIKNGKQYPERLPRDGSYVFSGRMGLHHGRSLHP